MTPQLSTEIHQALAAQPGQPLIVQDPATQLTYVLVPEAVFQRVQALLYDGSEPDVREFLPAAHQAFQEDWDAPGMELYDNYDAHRQQP